jgi:uncharacterized DUF497 family protein
VIEYDPVKNEVNIAKRGLPLPLVDFLFEVPLWKKKMRERIMANHASSPRDRLRFWNIEFLC